MVDHKQDNELATMHGTKLFLEFASKNKKRKPEVGIQVNIMTAADYLLIEINNVSKPLTTSVGCIVCIQSSSLIFRLHIVIY